MNKSPFTKGGDLNGVWEAIKRVKERRSLSNIYLPRSLIGEGDTGGEVDKDISSWGRGQGAHARLEAGPEPQGQ